MQHPPCYEFKSGANQTCTTPVSGGSPGSSTRVVLLCFDGMTWEVVNDLIDRGDLPHFAQAKKLGSYGNLKTHLPTLSPVIWSTIATGMKPYHHGILDFEIWTMKGVDKKLRLLPGRSFLTRLRLLNLLRSEPYTADFRNRPAIWEILNQYYSESIISINWFPSVPSEMSKGIQVSNYFHFDYPEKSSLRADIVYPSFLFGELTRFKMGKPGAREEVLRNLTSVPVEQYSRPFFYDKVLTTIYRESKTYGNISRYLYGKYRPDFFAYYLNATDAATHLYWKFFRNKEFNGVSEEEIQYFKNVVPGCYKIADKILGDFMKMADSNTVIMVVSDHGIHTAPYIQRLYFSYWQGREISASHVDAPDGVFLVFGKGIKPNHKLDNATVYDIVPTILHVMGYPVSKEFPGKVLQPVLVKRSPVQYVNCYSKLIRKKVSEFKFSPQHEEKLKQLKALGYLVGN